MSKRALAQALDSAGILEALFRARACVRKPWLTVLSYHRVHDDATGQLFDSSVIDATSQELSRQLETLRRYFTVIGLSELSAHLRGASLPANPAIVTFDDGYRDCHDRALPILLSHGVKGVFFVATSYVDHRRMFWWDRIAYVLRQSTLDQIELTYPVRTVLDRTLPHEKTLKTATSLVKNHFGIDVERFLGELAHAAGVPWSEELERHFADELVMSWEQIRRLQDAGMEVHSHTRTHRVLQTVGESELAWELAGARTDLEDHLEKRVTGVAYPVGRSVASWPAIRAAVRQSGYELGFSNGTGASPLGENFDPLNVRRISLERGLPDSLFRAMLALPALAETAVERRAP